MSHEVETCLPKTEDWESEGLWAVCALGSEKNASAQVQSNVLCYILSHSNCILWSTGSFMHVYFQKKSHLFRNPSDMDFKALLLLTVCLVRFDFGRRDLQVIKGIHVSSGI